MKGSFQLPILAMWVTWCGNIGSTFGCCGVHSTDGTTEVTHARNPRAARSRKPYWLCERDTPHAYQSRCADLQGPYREWRSGRPALESRFRGCWPRLVGDTWHVLGAALSPADPFNIRVHCRKLSVHLEGQLHPDHPHDVGVMLYASGTADKCRRQDVAFTIKVLNLKYPAKTRYGCTPTSVDLGRGMCKHGFLAIQHGVFAAWCSSSESMWQLAARLLCIGWIDHKAVHALQRPSSPFVTMKMAGVSLVCCPRTMQHQDQKGSWTMMTTSTFWLTSLSQRHGHAHLLTCHERLLHAAVLCRVTQTSIRKAVCQFRVQAHPCGEPLEGSLCTYWHCHSQSTSTLLIFVATLVPLLNTPPKAAVLACLKLPGREQGLDVHADPPAADLSQPPEASLTGDTTILLDGGDCSLRVHAAYLEQASQVLKGALQCVQPQACGQKAGKKRKPVTQLARQDRAAVTLRLPLARVTKHQALLLLHCLYAFDKGAWILGVGAADLFALAQIADRFACEAVLGLVDKALVERCVAENVDQGTGQLLTVKTAPAQHKLASSCHLRAYEALVSHFLGLHADKVDLTLLDPSLAHALRGANNMRSKLLASMFDSPAG